MQGGLRLQQQPLTEGASFECLLLDWGPSVAAHALQGMSRWPASMLNVCGLQVWTRPAGGNLSVQKETHGHQCCNDTLKGPHTVSGHVVTETVTSFTFCLKECIRTYGSPHGFC